MSFSQKDIKPQKRLLELIKLEKRDIKLVVFYSIFAGVLALFLPLGAQTLFSHVAFGTLFQPVFIITIVVLLMLGFSSLLQTFQVHIVEIIQRRIFVRISKIISQKLTHSKRESFDQISGPELVNRFFEILTIQKTKSLILMDGVSIVLQTIIGLVLLAFYHPYLLAFDIILILALVFIILRLGKGGVDTALHESKQKYKVASWLENVSNHLNLFQSSVGKNYVDQKTDELNRNYLRSRQNHFKILYKQYIGTFIIQAVASACVLALGGWLVIIGELTLGQLVAAELIVSVIVATFAKFGKYIESYYDLMASMDKLGQIFNLEDEVLPEAAFEIEEIKSIELDDVKYEYTGFKKLCSPINLKFTPGFHIVQIPNGQGKTTLSEILGCFREPAYGKMRVNGIDLSQTNLTEIRNRFHLVSKINLFPISILENLKLNKDNLELESIHQNLVDIGIVKQIEDLPNGINTELYSHIKPLSKNVAMKLCLVRESLQSPDVLILDDIMAYFNAEDTNHIFRYLKESFKNKTVIILTSDTRLADLAGTGAIVHKI